MKMKGMARRLAANAALLLVSAAAATALLELSIAILKPQPVMMTSIPSPFFIRYDPELGWANREGAEGVYNPVSGEKPVPVRINEYGLRGADVRMEKQRGIKRVIFLGDSNTFGYGIREGERFSELVSKKLPGNYQTLNLGVFGYGTDQELLQFERAGLRLRPDLVVLAFSAGDLPDNMCSVNGGSSKPYFQMENDRLVLRNSPVPEKAAFMKAESRARRLNIFFYNHSHLYRLFFNRLAASNIFIKDAVQEMTMEEGMRTTVELIGRLDGLCMKNGCQLAVLLLSHGQWIAASGGTGAEIGYFPTLKTLLASRGVIAIDPSGALVGSYGKGGAVFLKNDPVHLSPLGNEVVAGVLYQELVNRGLVDVSKGGRP